MADSAFWRDLEARFRALQPNDSDGLRAEWYSLSRRWLLRGAPSASVLRRFKRAAAFVAKNKGYPRGTSAVNSWLGVLKHEPDAYHVEAESTMTVKGKELRGGGPDSIPLRPARRARSCDRRCVHARWSLGLTEEVCRGFAVRIGCVLTRAEITDRLGRMPASRVCRHAHARGRVKPCSPIGDGLEIMQKVADRMRRAVKRGAESPKGRE